MDTMTPELTEAASHGLMAPRGVLFVGHEASRTGAPMALLRFMGWFRGAVNVEASCLLIHGGEMEKDFAALCPVTNLTAIAWREHGRGRRLLKKTGLSALGNWLFARSALRNQLPRPDLIFCNTVFALEALQKLPQLEGRIICYVHELEFAFRVCAKAEIISPEILSRVDRFIACSQAVADNLTGRHAIPPGRVDVVHEYIPKIEADPVGTAENRRRLRHELKLTPETLVVGSSGAFGWRKGTDLFVQTAKLVKMLQPRMDVHFLWLGGNLQSIVGLEFTRDVELSDLEECLTVIPSRSNPLDYFRGLDIFVSTSREDPYPLVCLEAAACGVPLICFDRSGGMPEFIEEDAGVVVPYLDINALADRTIELLQDKERRQRYGRAARQKAVQRHDVEAAGPKILAAMQQTLSG